MGKPILGHLGDSCCKGWQKFLKKAPPGYDLAGQGIHTESRVGCGEVCPENHVPHNSQHHFSVGPLTGSRIPFLSSKAQPRPRSDNSPASPVLTYRIPAQNCASGTDTDWVSKTEDCTLGNPITGLEISITALVPMKTITTSSHQGTPPVP